MTRILTTPATWIILLLLPLITIGCQLGLGAQPAPTPQPPAPPLPPVPPASDLKVIEGYLQVQYASCPTWPSQTHSIAPIILTDLRSGSFIFLNGNGTLKTRPKPSYKSDKGKATLEAALKDDSLMKQVVARPSCEEAYNPTVRQLDGWPYALAENIGNPPMPKVAMGASPAYAGNSPPQIVYPGWRGAYCWPVSGGSRECEDTATWKGFGAAEAIGASAGTIFYVTVLGDDANPGMVRRVRVLPAQERWSIRGRGLILGAEAHRAVATSGETLKRFPMPKLPAGVYMLIADYESPLGEVEYGFKVAYGK